MQITRFINRIIIHCSATWPGMSYTVAKLKNQHVEGNKWKDIGYHFYITRDGVVHTCRPLDLKGAHCNGFNDHSIGICYEGGVSDEISYKAFKHEDGSIAYRPYHKPEDNRTAEQRVAMYNLCKELVARFPIAHINGHNELCRYGAKACPSFDVSRSDLVTLLSA